MNRAEKRRQKKLAKKTASNAKLGKATNRTPEQQTLTLQQSLDLAVQHHNEGRLPEAESIYQQILQTDPNQPVALHLLGVIAHQVGKHDLAVDLITKAIAIKPDLAEAHNNLGNALQELGKLDEAVASYHKALAVKPDYAMVHNNLGTVLQAQDRLDDAIDSLRKAIAINPDYAEAHNNLGVAFKDLGKLDEAVASYHKAIAINPDYAEAHNNLGVAFKDLGKLDEAVTCHKTALDLNPDYAEAHSNLGSVCKKKGRLDDAISCYRKALGINQDLFGVHTNLGLALKDLGKLDEAVTCHKTALDLNPDYAEAHNNLGNALQELGKLDEAVTSYHKALAIKPDYALVHSNLLLSEQYRLGHSAESLFELHCEWDDRHGRAFRADWPPHRNLREAERRLKVGFVSPDLGRHPVGYFVVPLLENLPGHEIETVCYSDRIEDDLTRRIKAAADAWRDTCGVSDEDLTKTIRTDEIDILIDLSGHSARNRMLVFARKPAPLQVAWAGYVGTTGLSAIDYLVSDIYSTREDEEKFYREKIIRMPDGWLCYDPPAYAPEVGPQPSERNGSITFGSFSNPMKINEEVVSVWARILGRVANARLLIKFKGIDSTANADRLVALFEAEGVDRSRLMLEGYTPHAELLARYNDVDIALDPFPYSGGLTTYEALWMGVPVITVPGETFASRHSLSHLSTLGLPELVAHNRDDYVKLAVGLANNTGKLAGLRAELRGKMSSSPLCDGEKFAERFAMLMRDIWRNWCLSRGGDRQRAPSSPDGHGHPTT